MLGIIQTVSASILSMGIVGVMIWVIIKFSANKIAENLSAKYEHKLNEKLEAYKSELDKKNYISKARFDLEFSIYGEISNILLEAVEECFFLFPTQLDNRPEDNEKANEIFNQRYKAAHANVFKLQRIIGSKSPFISKELYSDFFEIKQLLSNQLTAYEYFGPIGRYRTSEDSVHNEEKNNAWKRTTEISEKHQMVIDKMRNYFDSLEIR